MACADVDMDLHTAAEEPGEADYKEALKVWRYKALEVIPEERGPLHNLLRKQPAALGIMSGLVSFALGIIFAVELQMESSFTTLFRVSHMSGLLFISAGFISVFLFKYPQLLKVSLMVNFGCIVIAVIAIFLISVDLAYSSPEPRDTFFELKVLELCVVVFKAILSKILCSCFLIEIRSKSP